MSNKRARKNRFFNFLTEETLYPPDRVVGFSCPNPRVGPNMKLSIGFSDKVMISLLVNFDFSGDGLYSNSPSRKIFLPI